MWLLPTYIKKFFFQQNAMKQQNIDFKEIDKDILGTEHEFKVPPTGSSWQQSTDISAIILMPSWEKCLIETHLVPIIIHNTTFFLFILCNIKISFAIIVP